jgi:hypothetical protein
MVLAFLYEEDGLLPHSLLPETKLWMENTSVPEFIDPVFVKTSPKRSFLVIENARFGLALAKTGSINLKF